MRAKFLFHENNFPAYWNSSYQAAGSQQILVELMLPVYALLFMRKKEKKGEKEKEADDKFTAFEKQYLASSSTWY